MGIASSIECAIKTINFLNNSILIVYNFLTVMSAFFNPQLCSSASQQISLRLVNYILECISVRYQFFERVCHKKIDVINSIINKTGSVPPIMEY